MTKYLLPVFAVLLFSCSSKMNVARIVLLPDTQTYAEKYPEILQAQADWIVKNKKDISLVLHQGDLTQNNNDKEWEVVHKEISKLNHVVPYALSLGNHDMGSAAGKFADTRNTQLFNRYFPYSVMSTLPAFGGVREAGKMDNAYYVLKTGKVKWLVLTLDFGPRDEALEWAGKIVEQHPHHLVILNTHAYMYFDSTRMDGKDFWQPQAYGIGKDTINETVNNGEQIWQKLVKKYPNIRFVFSGHVLNSGVGTLISINDEGYMVYQMLANYQEGVKGSIKGGNGWLRIIDMDFKKNLLKVSTYSPYINETRSEPAHHFLIKNVNYKPH